MVGIAAGGLLFSTAFALLTGLDEQAFLQRGRRIPFLASVILVAVGFWVRRSSTEPETFRAARDTNTIARLPLVTATDLVASGFAGGRRQHRLQLPRLLRSDVRTRLHHE